MKERDFTGLYGQLIPHDHWMELWDYDSRRAEYDGIELLAEMDARASDFLHELRYAHEKDNPKKPVNILIVAHAGIGLVFRATSSDSFSTPESSTSSVTSVTGLFAI
ncbi:histidine phosphatase family protein [Candidatus Saccharibacteria bacterium]|nr:histidine phosphatase family protein [Candidatus Saccharibacteria bacterium]